MSESAVRAAQPLWVDLPYRALVPIRVDGQGVTLFRVAGSETPECGAKDALKEAFGIFGGICYICSKRIAKADLTIDHIEPKALGGGSSLQNLALAHKRCNQAKGSVRLDQHDPNLGRQWLIAARASIVQRLKIIDG